MAKLFDGNQEKYFFVVHKGTFEDKTLLDTICFLAGPKLILVK